MNSQNDKENSGRDRAAIIGGVFAVLAACVGGIFLLLNTIVDKGTIVFGTSNPSVQLTATASQYQEPISTPTYSNSPKSSTFIQTEINNVLGIGNWQCFPDRLDGVSFLNVPENFVVKYPISSVDKQGIKYKVGEVVPSGGLATAWIEGQLVSRTLCP
jgi:hypothetical protein